MEDVESIAVLIPCYNEEETIGRVVRDFRSALPLAQIYVYDNNSTDGTSAGAAAAGAIVRNEPRQGKGNVVRRIFADIEASAYVLVDGDGTYDPTDAARMLALLKKQRLAMIVGRRVEESTRAYRSGHVLGNKVFTGSVGWLFGTSFNDILSGYRVFSRAFVKSFPAFSGGFEIETELTVHALTLGLPVAEVPTRYGARPAGSDSKLSTYRDGWRIVWAIFTLFKNEKPLAFFFGVGGLLLLGSLVLAYPLVVTFLKTGLVPRFPTAILCTGLAVSSLLMFSCGLILDTVTKGRRETKKLAYLSIRPDGWR
jgi:glycosyltransferase involved in cell wall biosynthesis